jgi:hypothetical protein
MISDESLYLKARLKIRAVFRELGAELVADEDDGHRFQRSQVCAIAPTFHLVGSLRTYPRPTSLHWYARFNGPGANGAPSINTALNRPIEAIAADLRRRLIPDGRVWCIEQAKRAGLARDAKHAENMRHEELAAILGGPLQRHPDGRNTHFHGLTISTSELSNGGNYYGEWTPEIRVKSWHCLLMIARLVAEDHRVHTVNNPSSQS